MYPVKARIPQSVLSLGYRMDDRGSIPCRGRNVSFPTASSPAPGVHPASYTLSTGASFFGQGHEADKSPSSSE
jgi:hypothetical protein